MIIVQIHSGLGNQLFMYAAGRALAVRHGVPLALDVDTDCREGRNDGRYAGHSYQLDHFNIKAVYLNQVAWTRAPGSPLPALFSTAKSRLRNVGWLRHAVRALRMRGLDLTEIAARASSVDKHIFREERGDWGYKPQFHTLPDGTILRGCFFSYRYFASINDILRDELQLRTRLSPDGEALREKMAMMNSVSLHVRRGDVVTNPEYRSWYEGVLTERYYRNAIEFFEQQLDHPHFFMFSDDMAWVKQHFPIRAPTTFVDHNGPEKGYEDLYLMSRCRHNVTSGFSSFSWWGAWLNPNPDKIVVRTRRMNALAHLDHPDDFFPPGWTIIES